ncbi:MAG: LysE family transporter [Ruminococcus sp.]|nr:LysE family transporter [Ruminococcus sp.]
MALYLLKGIIIGIICGVPVGAAGAMTIQRTMKSGVRQGLLTGLGSSVADSIFAGVGVFGATFVSDFFKKYSFIISIIGGAFIIFIGFNILNKKESTYKNGEGMRHFISSFTVGITNPVAIVAFLMAFSYMNIPKDVSIINGAAAVSGVFIGTFLWWLIIIYIAYNIKKKACEDIIIRFNKILSFVLIALGAIMIIKAVVRF